MKKIAAFICAAFMLKVSLVQGSSPDGRPDPEELTRYSEQWRLKHEKLLAEPNLNEIEARVAKGEAFAQLTLGLLYQEGSSGFPKNPAKAFQLYQQAADSGLAAALVAVGTCHLTGVGTAQDRNKSARYFKQAAEAGNPVGKFLWGMSHQFGYGVKANLAEAARWYSEAAESGYAPAQCNLGLLFEYGSGVKEDPVRAVELYRLAAEQGYASAQFQLGVSLGRGSGVNQDLKEAVIWYRKAAEQGNASAQHNLGNALMNGRGTPADYPGAVHWLTKAAESGTSESQFALALMYFFGLGIDRDVKVARYWAERATAQRHLRAQGLLGHILMSAAQHEQDRVRGMRILREAAEAGAVLGQHGLGAAYADGSGGEKNAVEAYKWLSLSALQGYEESSKMRDELAKSMTPVQIAKSNKAVKNFKAKPWKSGER